MQENTDRLIQGDNCEGEGGNARSKICYTWDEIETMVKDLGDQLKKTNKKYDCVLGITNGGIIPARLLARELDIELIQLMPVQNRVIVKSAMPYLYSDRKYLIVDDIYDTGDTYKMTSKATAGLDCNFVFCVSRHAQYYGLTSRVLNNNQWIIFPWESRDKEDTNKPDI